MTYDWINDRLGKTTTRDILLMVKQQMYVDALRRTGGHIGKAAQLLGVHRNCVRDWRKKAENYVRITGTDRAADVSNRRAV